MIVECIINKFKFIPEFIYTGLHGYSREIVLPIEIGAQSIVYGIQSIKGHPWLLVDVEELRYPMYYPSCIFKVIDGRISKYWLSSSRQDMYFPDMISMNFGFPELVNDEFFYGEYIEDSAEHAKIFMNYKNLILNEY